MTILGCKIIIIMNIIVLGIGQSLRGDDAAGLEAVRLWQQQYPQTKQKVHVEFSELPGLALLDLLEDMQVAVLVDAVHAPDLAPGSLLHLGPEDLAAFDAGAQSAHGWGVAETLALGYSLHPELKECRITLIGIASSQFRLGTSLSCAVQDALVEAAASIEKEVQGWLGGLAGKTNPGLD